MKSLISAGALLAMTTAASAATVTFEFSGQGGYHGPTSFADTTGSYSVNVSGIQVDAGTGNTDRSGAVVGQWYGGLGICEDVLYSQQRQTDYCHRDMHQIDGTNGNDLVLFDFGQAVKILSASFSFAGGNDDFAFGDYSNGSNPLGWTYADIAQSGTSGADNGSYDFGGLTSSIFGIGATDGHDDNDGQDEWKLYSITVEFPAEVPLPASALLMLGGLGAIAMVRRRPRA